MSDRPDSPCPDRPDLIRYIQHRLPERSLRTIAEHLETCFHCQAMLKAMRSSSETALHVADRRPPDHAVSTRHKTSPAKQSPLCPATESLAGSATPSQGRSLGSVGNYVLLELLGKGGMGTVYKAIHTRLKKVVAVKLLQSDCAHDTIAIARFQREMEAIGRLEHPHVVRATDAGESHGVPYLVMEYVQGADVQRLLDSNGPLPTSDACEIIRQAALGLDYVHRNGLVHRDIKPSNLMLAHNGEVKILDLGLARLYRERRTASPITGEERLLGTVDFMAPEQCSGGSAVDIRADIYSLGCTFYALLAGHPPFGLPQFRTPFEKMTAHVQAPPIPLRQLNAETPRDVATFIHQMLDKQPDHRPQRPGEIVSALEPHALGHELSRRARQATVDVATTDTWPGEKIGTTDAPQARHPAQRRSVLLRRVAAAIFCAAAIVAGFAVNSWFNDDTGVKTPLPIGVPVAFDPVPGFAVSVTERAELRGHSSEIWSVAFAPDGALLASAGVDRVIKIWDPIAGREIRQLPRLPAEVRCITFSPAGTVLASGGADQMVTLWNPISGQRITSLPGHDGEVRQMAFSPDGKMLASVGYDTSLRLWNPASTSCLHRIEAHSDRAQAVAFFDNQMVATSGDDKTIKFWNVHDGTLLRTIEDAEDSVMSIAFSADSRLLAAANWDSSVALHEQRSGWKARRLRGHHGPVRSVCFSPDGLTLASAGRDHLVILWDVPTSRIMKVIDKHKGDVTSVAFSPNGELLASAGSDQLVRIWDVNVDRSGQDKLERSAVAWMLREGGKLGVRTYHGESRSVDTPDDMPDGGFHIVGIELPANTLGTVQDVKILAPLVAVDSLRLAGTNLTDDGLSCLKEMTHLRYANLSSTQVTGAGFEQFASLSELATLRITDTEFDDVGMRHLCKATALQTLYLSQTQISDVGCRLLGNFRQLRSLFLSSTNVTSAGVASLRTLKKLEQVELDYTKVGDEGLSSLAQVENLQSLRLTGTPVTDVGMESLQRAHNLKNISLEGTKVTNRGVADLLAVMPEIHSLHVSDTAVTLDGLHGLRGHPELRELSINNPHVTDAVFDYLQPATDLAVLNLYATRITDAGLERLAGCRQLVYLFLRETNVTGHAFAKLQSLTKLRELFLARTQVDDRAIVHIGGLVQLQALDLANTRVTDDGLQHLMNLRALQNLDLTGTRTSDEGLLHLKGLSALTFLQLSGTQTTERGIDLLRRAIPGCQIERLALSQTP